MTGAGSGIGRATVLRLALEGAHVVGCSTSPDGLEGTLAEVRAAGADAALVPADVTEPADRDRVVDEALRRFGRVDLVANVAGVSDGYLPAHEVDDETWARVMDVNVTAVMALCRTVLPTMMSQGSGAITNVGSVTSLSGAIGGLAYTTSKHAIVGLTRSIAWAYKEHGVRCNAVCPGAVTTNFEPSATARSAWGYEQVKKTHRLCPRVAEADEVATIISWLSSAEASNLDGAVIAADGGWLA